MRRFSYSLRESLPQFFCGGLPRLPLLVSASSVDTLQRIVARFVSFVASPSLMSPLNYCYFRPKSLFDCIFDVFIMRARIIYRISLADAESKNNCLYASINHKFCPCNCHFAWASTARNKSDYFYRTSVLKSHFSLFCSLEICISWTHIFSLLTAYYSYFHPSLKL